MPVLALQLDTGGSEVYFGRLRLSQGVGYSVGHRLHGSSSICCAGGFRRRERSSQRRLSVDDRVCFASLAQVQICSQKL